MKKLYCISGLGADERIFGQLSIAGVELVHLAWLPFEKDEALGSYAMKMAGQIPEEDPMILGLSFGGMIGVEIAKQQPVKRLFLVSSAKGRRELPDISGWLRFMVLKGWLPYKLMKIPNSILFERFGAQTREEKELMAAIMNDTDPAFMRWAFRAILKWQNIEVPKDLVHIHGKEDRILPPEYIHPNYWIEGGSHIMIYNKAAEVSNIISRHI